MGHEHKVSDKDTIFSINPITRAIKNESNRKTTLIQGDHNSERYTFEIPRYVEGHDMSLCNKVEVHYFNIKENTNSTVVQKGIYTVEDLHLSEDEEKVICSWLISENSTQFKGMLNFLLRYKCVEDGIKKYAWNTAFYTEITVSEGSDAAESFETDYVDIIEQWKETVLQYFSNELNQWKAAKERELHENMSSWQQNASENLEEWKTEQSDEVHAVMGDYEEYMNRQHAELKSRMDTFTSLKDGSTTGDAELMDGRNDGITVHANIGNAIRSKTKADFEILEATKLAQPIIPFMDRLEIGFVQIKTDGLTYKEYTNYVRTKEGTTIHLDVGDTITCANETRVYAGYLHNGEYCYEGWTSNFVSTVSADYVLLFSYYDTSEIIDIDSFLDNITITRADNYYARTESLNRDTKHLLSLENTYLSKCKLNIGDATSTNTMRFCAKLEQPVYGAKISVPSTIRYGIQGYSDSKYTTKTYDSGWLTADDFVIFENPELYYVLIFIRIDETEPTIEDRNNTIVLQSLNLTPIIDNLNAISSVSTLAHYDSSNDLIRSVAHRGLSDVAPENTTPAFVLAKQAGFTYVETDVQVTSDGKYVCVHDQTISKYTNGVETGTVADYTLEELQEMDFGAWKGEEWKGTKILTFEEFILLCKKLGLKAYVELKYSHSEADVAYYLEYVKKMGMSENCVWRGAEYNTIIRELSDAAILAYDATRIMTEEKVKYIIEKYSPLFFHNDYTYVTEEIVELCHVNGVRIETYTVNNEDILEDLAIIGVDGITTDKLIACKMFFEKLI